MAIDSSLDNLTLAHFVKNRKILILFFIRQTNYSIDNISLCQILKYFMLTFHFAPLHYSPTQAQIPIIIQRYFIIIREKADFRTAGRGEYRRNDGPQRTHP